MGKETPHLVNQTKNLLLVKLNFQQPYHNTTVDTNLSTIMWTQSRLVQSSLANYKCTIGLGRSFIIWPISSVLYLPFHCLSGTYICQHLSFPRRIRVMLRSWLSQVLYLKICDVHNETFFLFSFAFFKIYLLCYLINSASLTSCWGSMPLCDTVPWLIQLLTFCYAA